MMGYVKVASSMRVGNHSYLNLGKIPGEVRQKILPIISEATKGTRIRVSGKR